MMMDVLFAKKKRLRNLWGNKMLYLGETKDIGEHSLIEIKTDEDIAIPFGEKKKVLELSIPEELRAKFCFIDSVNTPDLFISDYTDNDGHLGESIKLNILKLDDYERDITIPVDSLIGYLGVIKADTSIDNTNSEFDLGEIEIKILDKQFRIDKQAKKLNPNGDVVYIISLSHK